MTTVDVLSAAAGFLLFGVILTFPPGADLYPRRFGIGLGLLAACVVLVVMVVAVWLKANLHIDVRLGPA